MRLKAVALIAAVALLALVPPAFAQGPVSGSFSTGPSSGTFSGTYSGGPSGTFSGTSSLGTGSYSGPIWGTFSSPTASGSFSGTYSGTAASGIFTSGPVSAPEPVAALVVGLGLLAARLLRRR